MKGELHKETMVASSSSVREKVAPSTFTPKTDNSVPPFMSPASTAFTYSPFFTVSSPENNGVPVQSFLLVSCPRAILCGLQVTTTTRMLITPKHRSIALYSPNFICGVLVILKVVIVIQSKIVTLDIIFRILHTLSSAWRQTKHPKHISALKNLAALKVT